jgi:hypothetical protein
MDERSNDESDLMSARPNRERSLWNISQNKAFLKPVLTHGS